MNNGSPAIKGKATGEFDIIVAGGGPAGLSLASQLGSEWRTCLLERRTLGRTRKMWMAVYDRLSGFPPVSGVVRYRFDRVLFRTYLGTRLEIRDDFAMVDESAILNHWLSRCEANRIELKEGCSLLDAEYDRSSRQVEVHTSGGDLRCRLLVDTTGSDSLLLGRIRCPKPVAHYSLYGRVISHARFAKPNVVVGEALLDRKPILWRSVFPLSDEATFLCTYACTENRIEPSFLRSAFEEQLQLGPHAKCYGDGVTLEEKWGTIPCRTGLTPALDGIYFYGDTAGISPPQTGIGFDAILESSRRVALFLSRRLARGQLGAGRLRWDWRTPERRANMELQAICSWFLRDSGPADADSLIRAAGKVAPEVSRRFLRGDLEMEDAMTFLAALIRATGFIRLIKRFGFKGILFVLYRLIRAGYWFAFRIEGDRMPRA